MNGKTILSYELRITPKKGRYLHGEFLSAPETLSGKIVGQDGIGSDVTRHKTEKAENLHYSHLVQSADSAIISRDLNGIITTWNKASEKLFGYKASEAIGRHFSLIVPNNNSHELAMIQKKILKGKPIEDYETVRIMKDGTEIDVIAKISPILDRDGTVIGTSVFDRDNTVNKKRREHEELLVKANRILFSSLKYSTTMKRLARFLVPDIADWCSVHVIEDDELERLVIAHEDPKMLKWAEEMQMKYATKGSDSATQRVVATGVPEFYPEITPQLLKRHVSSKEQLLLIEKLNLRSLIVAPIVSAGKTFGAITFVLTQQHKSYTPEDLKFAVELGKLSGQAIDNARLFSQAQKEIEKRRKVEAELRHSRDQQSIILENVADGITLQDEHGKLIYANEAAAHASGYASARQMMRNPKRWTELYEIRNEEGGRFDLSQLPGRRALQGEKNPTGVIFFTNKKTREERWSLIKARPIMDDEGKVAAVVNIVSDMTERKELERRKDDFISIASHELKTPLTSMKGFVHLLKRRIGEDGEKNLEYIEKIDRQIHKLTGLIEELLDLSRLRAGKLIYCEEPFVLSRVVEEVVEDLRESSATHSVELRSRVDATVMGDRERISQVLINLITNAIKYSPKEKTVVVEMKQKKQEVEVIVKDFGIGINNDEIEKIFDRFYRVKDVHDKTYPGLGIGLFISREIVARHGGRIWATSKKGDGSEFHFTLPLKDAYEKRARN